MTVRRGVVAAMLAAAAIAIPATGASADPLEDLGIGVGGEPKECPPATYPRVFLYSPTTGKPLLVLCWPWPEDTD